MGIEINLIGIFVNIIDMENIVDIYIIGTEFDTFYIFSIKVNITIDTIAIISIDINPIDIIGIISSSNAYLMN